MQIGVCVNGLQPAPFRQVLFITHLLEHVACQAPGGTALSLLRKSHLPGLEILHVDAEGAGELGHGVERAGLLAGLDLA
jgi:hypothetical protein